MSSMVATPALNLGLLADALDAANTLTGAALRLFKNDIVPTPNTLIGEYTPADYTGFGDEAITWGAPSVADDGAAEVVGIAGEFRPTGTTVTNTIFGCMLISAGGALLGAARFDDGPKPMNSTFDSLIVTVRVRPDAGGMMVDVS